jgi:hypothetical protein
MTDKTKSGFSATKLLETEDGKISYDDSGDLDNNKPIIICVPGIGDLKEQVCFQLYSFL